MKTRIGPCEVCGRKAQEIASVEKIICMDCAAAKTKQENAMACKGKGKKPPKK